MKQTLNLKVSQQLSLTPQLKQSLRLLQLSSLDLEQEIQQSLDANPLLERVENEPATAAQSASTETLAGDDSAELISQSADPELETGNVDNLVAEQKLDADWQQAFEPQRISDRQNSSDRASPGTEFAQYVSKPETLVEHLNWQIRMTTLSDKDKQIAEALIYCLDDDGYLTGELSDIRKLFPPDLMVETDEINAVLNLLKTLDPIGAGAADLQERLLILLQQLPRDTSGLAMAQLIVADHLPLLASRNYTKLRKDLGISETELSASLELITGLNPRIASKFKADNQNYVIPDVLVKKIAGIWTAKLNSDNQSKLRTNKTYTDLLKSTIDKQDSDYIQQNLMQAKMFIKGLMSRYDTLLLVAEAIVERQQMFFEHGPEQMQPMVLQDIAEHLEMHESTISRATSGKYLLCASGLYELKYFFSSALASSDGAASSSTAIRSLIRKMVDNEPKIKPLSDSKIASALEKQGHIVARRTVAKYRESMQIAPSSQRKTLQ
ncbi:MAG: RNA polymerase factor sigma-54, partial [Gammaproteobacteria bacterium]|nr:RNA polymerase factor sigma-54 [Gammaproteobacteria bacterium]